MLKPDERIYFTNGAIHLLVTPATLRLEQEDYSISRPAPGQARPMAILRQMEALGVRITPALVKQWGLRIGDAVTLHDGQILSVEGLKTPTESLARSSFQRDLVGGDELAYGRKEIPVWMAGDPSVNVVCGLGVRIPLGGRIYVIGAANCGKSTMAQHLLSAMMECCRQGLGGVTPANMKFFYLSIERPEDAHQVKGQFRVGSNSGLNCEFYSALSSDEIYVAAIIVARRARSVVERGGHAVVLLDSMWNMIMGIGPLFEGSMAGSGVSNQAVRFAKENFLPCGAVSNGGSLTFIITSLFEGPNSSSGSVLREVGLPVATAVIGLRTERELSTGRPWVDVGLCNTRGIEHILSPEAADLQRVLSDWLAPMAPEAQAAALREMFVAKMIPFERGAILAYIKALNGASNGLLKSQSAVINAGAQLKSLVTHDSRRALDTVLLLLTNSFGTEVEEAILALVERLSEDDRVQFLRLLREKGILKELPPKEALLASARALLDLDVTERRQLVLEVAAWLGLKREEFQPAKAEALDLMMKVSAYLKTQVDRGFGRDVAAKLVQAGLDPFYVLVELLSGRTPAQLLKSNGGK